MPPTCTICRHPSRASIEEAVVSGLPLRRIASQFDTSDASLRRHKPHMGKALAKAQESREVSRGESVLDQLRTLHEKALSILAGAELEKNPKLMLAAIREARGNLALWADLLGLLKLTGETEQRVVFVVPPEAAALFRGTWLYPQGRSS